MSRPLPAFAAEVRRRLLARPGITAEPQCAACEVAPRLPGRELCLACEAERAEAAVYFQAQLDATLSNEPSLPAEPMFGSEDASRAFLPDDEDFEGPERRQVRAEDKFTDFGNLATSAPGRFRRCEGCGDVRPNAELAAYLVAGKWVFVYCGGCDTNRLRHPTEKPLGARA